MSRIFLWYHAIFKQIKKIFQNIVKIPKMKISWKKISFEEDDADRSLFDYIYIYMCGRQ